VLVLGLMALLSMAEVLRKVAPPEGESRLATALEPKAREVAQIPELARLERELKMGAGREFDLHYRVRPVVREIVSALLEQRGARLDPGSDAVRELLGEELWELVSPERKPPPDRLAPGPGLAALRRTVERLERL
jgi:hypothetical protein